MKQFFKRIMSQVWANVMGFILAVIFVFCSLVVEAKANESVTFALFTRGSLFEMMKGGEPCGLAVDLFNELMPEDLDKKIVPMPAPRKALHPMTKPVHTRLEAKKWMSKSFSYWWSDPVMVVKNELYSASRHPIEYDGPKSLKGLTIGCIKNYFYPAIQSLFDSGEAKRYDVNSDEVLLRMVKAGRVDVAVFDGISAAWLIRNSSILKKADFHVAQNPVDQVELRFVFNFVPEWAKWMPKINERIREKRDDGTVGRLIENYQ